MAEPISIRITNLAQIKSAFSRSPKDMLKELNKAIKKTVLEIGSDSRKGTPVDTGSLRASTYERFSDLKGEVGTNKDYDIFVHEGTRYMRGRPYLRKAVDANAVDTEKNFINAVQNVLDKIGNEV